MFQVSLDTTSAWPIIPQLYHENIFVQFFKHIVAVYHSICLLALMEILRICLCGIGMFFFPLQGRISKAPFSQDDMAMLHTFFPFGEVFSPLNHWWLDPPLHVGRLDLVRSTDGVESLRSAGGDVGAGTVWLCGWGWCWGLRLGGWRVKKGNAMAMMNG